MPVRGGLPDELAQLPRRRANRTIL